jgi:hypothetical protein
MMSTAKGTLPKRSRFLRSVLLYSVNKITTMRSPTQLSSLRLSAALIMRPLGLNA